MAKSMTPSVEWKAMTDGQIEKAVEAYRAMLRKHRNELNSDAVQQVLGSAGYVAEMVDVLRRRAEAVSDLIIRRVKVNRSRAPGEAIKATGWSCYVDDTVVDTMPNGEGDEVEVCFFQVGHYVSDADLEKEYELRGLTPADPYSLAAVNEADPAFADDHPNSTHWKNADGKWCYAAFHRWDGERSVDVDRRVNDWNALWWFGGLRK